MSTRKDIQVNSSKINKTRFSVIKGPFVHKKSGESFVFSYYKSFFTLKLNSKYSLDKLTIKSILTLLFKNVKTPILCPDVELRIISSESHGFTQKL